MRQAPSPQHPLSQVLVLLGDSCGCMGWETGWRWPCPILTVLGRQQILPSTRRRQPSWRKAQIPRMASPVESEKAVQG